MEGPPSAQGEDQVTIQPASQPMSPLRRRMLEDMSTRGLRQDTQRDYIRFVRSFAEFLRRPPDTATPEDIRRFQVHQAESGVQPQSINCSVSALRFFLTVTLDRPDLLRRFILVRYPRKLPTVLNVEEVGAARDGTRTQVQGCPRHCLWCRITGVRGSSPQDRRHRQHAHADPGRAGQRTQGPQCHAVAAAAGTAAALVTSPLEHLRLLMDPDG